jgi:hypothetical protein
MVCLAPVGQLKQLTLLTIEENDSNVAEHSLVLLTGLSQLQQLKLGEQKHISGEAMEGFWAAVRQQRDGS